MHHLHSKVQDQVWDAQAPVGRLFWHLLLTAWSGLLVHALGLRCKNVTAIYPP